MTEPVERRLHISGLSPNISPADISERLSKFGTVKAVDGFGLLDGVGLPRKFGYITICMTQMALKECQNVFSGSTYRGAKLRITEAVPDFRERLIKERASSQACADEAEPLEAAAAAHATFLSPVRRETIRPDGSDSPPSQKSTSSVGDRVAVIAKTTARRVDTESNDSDANDSATRSRPSRNPDTSIRARIDVEVADSLRLADLLCPDDAESEDAESASHCETAHPVRLEGGTEASGDEDDPMQGIDGTLRSPVYGERDSQRTSVARPENRRDLAPPTGVLGGKATLKDMFLNGKEPAGFSLMDHLQLDLELDDGTLIDPLPEQMKTHTLPISKQTSMFDLSPSQTLFFPASEKSALKDPLMFAKERGWSWDNPTVGFYRTGSAEDIHSLWEQRKIGLTNDWKKAWKDAKGRKYSKNQR